MKPIEKLQKDLFAEFPDVMNFHQFRAALGIGKRTAYHLLMSGKIKCFRLANAYKIPKTSLIEYIENSCKGGTEK